jgi:hypothetical protein
MSDHAVVPRNIRKRLERILTLCKEFPLQRVIEHEVREDHPKEDRKHEGNP